MSDALFTYILDDIAFYVELCRFITRHRNLNGNQFTGRILKWEGDGWGTICRCHGAAVMCRTTTAWYKGGIRFIDKSLQVNVNSRKVPGTGNSVLPRYVENSIRVSFTDLAVYFPNIFRTRVFLRSSRTGTSWKVRATFISSKRVWALGVDEKK